MLTSERKFRIVTFLSVVEGQFFAQVHNTSRTRVVHETGLYPTKQWAKHAAKEWANGSQSIEAQCLEIEGEK